MKRKIGVLALLTAMVFTFFGSEAFSASASADSGEARYTQKIVSVLYDNSGSMGGANRNEYALYAMQMLMALLDKNSILVITPMNDVSKASAPAVTDKSHSIEVDLAAGDRNAEINRVLNSSSSLLSKDPNGGTPGSVISVAVDQLKDRGMKNKDNLWDADPNKEYWLVVLTDGEFNEQTGSVGADDVIEQYVRDYPSLRTIFLGFGTSAPDLSGSSLTQTSQFTPYTAASSEAIIDVMQQVANQMSGRYTMDSSYYSVNGKRVTIDLDKCDFSLKSISVIAQDCGATLTSATYRGSPVDLSQVCIITPKAALKMQDGYSAVINGAPYLAGGKLELEFSAPVSSLSVLAEPALKIVPYLEYKEGSSFERVDMQFINANLTAGDKIRVGYEVYELANGTLVDLEKVFGKTSSSVTYAGKTYQTGQEFPLEIGSNEIGVSVSVMDGAYTLYASMICIIEANPFHYRVEAEHEDEIPSGATKTEALYTVYVNDLPLTAAELNAYTWEVEATDPNGKTLEVQATVGADGKIRAVLNIDPSTFGTYQMEFTVTSAYGMVRRHTQDIPYNPSDYMVKVDYPETIPSDMTSAEAVYTVYVANIPLSEAELAAGQWELTGRAPDGSEADVQTTVGTDGKITAVLNVTPGSFGSYELTFRFTSELGVPCVLTHKINYYPAAVTLQVSSDDVLSLSQYQLLDNGKGFAFELFSDGTPFSFDNGLTSYRVLVDGTDVTAHAVIEGNRLTYIPKQAHFGDTVLSAGDKTVTVQVDCAAVPTLSASASAKLSVLATAYTIEAVESDHKTVDRFRLKDTEAVLYFRLLRDGVPVSQEELQAALDNKDITVSDKGTFSYYFWLPCGKELSVETLNGETVLACRVVKDWIRPFDSFAAMMILNGDKPVTVACRGSEATDAFTFTPSSAWSYIWRILVILLILYLLFYIIGFFNGKCKNLPSGLFVTIAPSRIGDKKASFSVVEVNLSFASRWGWHLKRLIPFHIPFLWYHQSFIEDASGNVSLGYDRDGNGIFRFKQNYSVMRYRRSSPDAKPLNDYKNSCYEAYEDGGAFPAFPAIKSSDIPYLFDFVKEMEANSEQDISEACFAFTNKKTGRMERVVFFIEF